MIWFGLVFLISGLLTTLSCMYFGIVLHEPFVAFFGVPFGCIFILAGWAGVIAPELRRRNETKQALINGKKIHGVIIDYEDDNSVIINGVPILVVIVRADLGGRFKDFGVNTHQTRENTFPRGAECDIYLYNDKVFIDPNSVVTSVSATQLYNHYIQQESISNLPVKPGLNPEFLQNEYGQPIMDRYAADKYNAPAATNSSTGEYTPQTDEYSNRIPGVTYLNGKPVDKNGRPL